MSIGKRLIDLAKSELNSLLDRAAQLDDDDKPASGGDEMGEPPREAHAPPPRSRGPVPVAGCAWRICPTPSWKRRSNGAGWTASWRSARAATPAPAPPRAPAAAPAPWSPPGDPIAKAYAALEVPPGSNFETVRKAYRNLMRKYHPDRHTTSPEKQKAANELAQKLTASYDILEKHLRK